MTILILILIGTLAAIYAITTLCVLRELRRARIDERRDQREIGRYGPRLHPRSRGGRR